MRDDVKDCDIVLVEQIQLGLVEDCRGVEGPLSLHVGETLPLILLHVVLLDRLLAFGASDASTDDENEAALRHGGVTPGSSHGGENVHVASAVAAAELVDGLVASSLDEAARDEELGLCEVEGEVAGEADPDFDLPPLDLVFDGEYDEVGVSGLGSDDNRRRPLRELLHFRFNITIRSVILKEPPWRGYSFFN